MSATNTDTTSASTPTFISALVVGLVTFTVYMVLFWILHSRFKKIFQPRTFLAPSTKQPQVLPNGLFGFFRTVISEPDIRAGELNGPDAYFFVRFIKFLAIVLVPYWIITWAVLMPINAIKPNNGQDGLNLFTYGNVPLTHNNRHYAHLACALALIAWTCFMLYREFRHFLRIRQAYLNSPAHATLARSRTVMLNNLPKGWHNEERIRELASFTHGPVEQVWIPRNVKAMEKLFDERNKQCVKLEAAEAKVQTLAAKNVEKKKLPSGGVEEGNVLSRYLLPKQRPTHRTGLLGLLGKKVNTLEYSPRHIREQEELLVAERAKLDACPTVPSAFVRFAKQTDAHMFAQLVKKQPGAKLVGAAVEVVPEDIVWANLSISPVMRKVRTLISMALTAGLIIFWAIPVAFVGVISQIHTVCNKLSFLRWICDLPPAVVGIIQGILPPALLAVLFMLLPIVLRIFIKLQGEPRRSDIERKLWTRFWIFQFVHGLIIVAFGSGLPEALQDINKTAKDLPNKLATSLPKSSIFFLTFILTNTFAKAASTTARVVPVVLSKLAFIFRGKTPRKAFQYDWKMDSIALATTWPPVALLGCIAIVYSVIQPIVTGFAVVGMFLLYITYKYYVIWIVDQPDALETGGLYYPSALRAVFCSMYILEIFMIGLFFLLRNPDNGQSIVGVICGSVMAGTLVLTILFQLFVEKRFYHKYIFIDTSGFPLGESAERLWPANPQDAETVQPNTLNLDSDVVAHHQARYGAGEEYGNTTGLHQRAFDNPATWKSQPVVWIANDVLGIGRAEVSRLTAERVASSCDYATRDAKGKVEVERGPPDEAWYGGKTQA